MPKRSHKKPLRHFSAHLCRDKKGRALALCKRLVRGEYLVPSDDTREISCPECRGLAGSLYIQKAELGGLLMAHAGTWEWCCSKKGVSAPEFERALAHRGRIGAIFHAADTAFYVGRLHTDKVVKAIESLSAADRRRLAGELRRFKQILREGDAVERKAIALFHDLRDYAYKVAAEVQQ